MSPAIDSQLKYIQFDKQLLQGKRGVVVEYLIVVSKIADSRLSAAAFEIFQLCLSFFASARIRSGRSGVFSETSLE